MGKLMTPYKQSTKRVAKHRSRAKRTRRGEREQLPEVGDLLNIEAVDRTGLVITSEGALVRIVEVTPPNPLILSDTDRQRTAAAFCHLVARLRPGQTLQFYVEARPINLAEILAEARREVREWAGEPPVKGQPIEDSLARSRWRLYGAMEDSLRRHADHQAAVQTTAYVVVPYLPHQRAARAALSHLRSRKRLPSDSLKRDLQAHRRAVRESLAHADAMRQELDALSLPTHLLNGEEVVSLLWSRFNPTQADAGRGRAAARTEILGELDAPVDLEEAQRAATNLRSVIAGSGIDFEASRHYAEIDRDLEQTIYASTTADNTYMGWLLGAMLTRAPFTMSMYVHALDRRAERSRIKRSWKTTFALNRTSAQKGRPLDPDRWQKEGEHEQLLAEMAGHERANIYEVSVYQSLRARGPKPDVASLAESVDWCAEQIESSSDCRVNRGEFQQRELWESTLPLGRDVAGRTRKYATRNVGDTVPLLGTRCGSPTGIPFAFSDPGRNLERINPFDRAHKNGTLVIAGQSGTGKTVAANKLTARCIAHGARAFVLDRAGHYRTLVDLVDGASHIDIGADDSHWAINPWDVPDTANVSLEKISFLVSLHGVMTGDEGLTTLERSHLGAAIRAVYARAAVTDETPRESMLREQLLRRASEERDAGAADIAVTLRNLADRLGEFCGDGSYAYLLDRETNVSIDSALVVFDTMRCPEVVLQPVMFSIIEYVTRAIERHRNAYRDTASLPNAPLFAGKSLLLIDEGWHLVGRRETGEYANDLARRARHLGLFLIVMSQHLSDFGSEYGLALLANSTMQLLFAQPETELPFIHQALGLSAEQTALIGRLKTVKGSHSQAFWINGTRGRSQVSLRLGPVEYWAYTSDPIKDVPIRDAKIVEHDGDVWAALAELARTHDPATMVAA